MSPRVILASQSPRRQELLKHIYKYFEIVPSNASEDINEANPSKLVERLSLIKAEEVYSRVQDEDEMVPELTGMKRLSKMFKSSKLNDTDNLLVIGADTIVVLDGEILGKPKDEEDAVNMLKRLQGRAHEVYTGVTVIRNVDDDEDETGGSGAGDSAETIQEEGSETSIINITFHEKTVVHIAEMTDDEIKKYVETGDPLDKAGSYGIQTVFMKYVSGIEGDYNNVVGLPVARLYAELKKINAI